MIDINPNVNFDFAKLFFELFQSELILELPESLKNNGAIFLVDKIDLLEEFKYAMPIIFKGFGQKMNLISAIDETEFHLAILSFFMRYGNIYRKTEYLDGKYEESVSIAFYNIHTKNIEVASVSLSEKFTDSQLIHLNWLTVIKEIIYKILTTLKSKNLDSSLIKNYHSQYIELQNREKSQTEIINEEN